jgi:hypothetical protein
MHTPYFPAWRSRLAALGRRTARALRQATLAQLQDHLRDFLPAPLLSTEDEGPNSRERIFSLRLTCECFLWQVLNPHTACREVVRQVQALFRSHRGFRSRRVTLVTTLLDPQRYPAEDLIVLYARRWRLELCLRDLKTTMGMEPLRCKTPDMAEKELLAYLVAHNLIRGVMAEAVARYAVDLERVSFKGTVDALRQYTAQMDKARSRRLRRQLWEDLLLNLARDLVRHRPNRLEPRAVKRRLKPYPLLNRPRRSFKEISHRNRYWKGCPRNCRSLN